MSIIMLFPMMDPDVMMWCVQCIEWHPYLYHHHHRVNVHYVYHHMLIHVIYHVVMSLVLNGNTHSIYIYILTHLVLIGLVINK